MYGLWERVRRDSRVRTASATVLVVAGLGGLAGMGLAANGGGIAAAQYEYGQKVTICHKGHEITVSSHALKAHLKHGDTVGECP